MGVSLDNAGSPTVIPERGFDDTTIDDIAREAGIGRRTFFRYFASKNELPWGECDRLLDALRAHLAAVDESVPTMHAVRQAVLEYADWRAVIADPTADLPTLLEAAFATTETVFGVREE